MLFKYDLLGDMMERGLVQWYFETCNNQLSYNVSPNHYLSVQMDDTVLGRSLAMVSQTYSFLHNIALCRLWWQVYVTRSLRCLVHFTGVFHIRWSFLTFVLFYDVVCLIPSISTLLSDVCLLYC